MGTSMLRFLVSFFFFLSLALSLRIPVAKGKNTLRSGIETRKIIFWFWYKHEVINFDFFGGDVMSSTSIRDKDDPCPPGDPCESSEEVQEPSQPCGDSSRTRLQRPRNCELNFSELLFIVLLSVVVFFILLWLKPWSVYNGAPCPEKVKLTFTAI